jgi:MoxR-like ATPase
VQSALLEVMAERQVSLGGVTYPLPQPFLVLATQNPIESEGVYPLPEAQRDRFLMRIPVDYPTAHEEHEIVNRARVAPVEPAMLLSTDDVLGLQAAARAVDVDPAVQDYAVRLVLATRDPKAHGVDIGELLAFGASPRASIGLVHAGRALALLRGREHLLPQDVYDVAYDVLNHRLVLSFDAVADDVTVDDVLVKLLTEIVAPRLSSSELASRAAARRSS